LKQEEPNKIETVFTVVVKNFGARGAHILLPKTWLGKVVEVRLVEDNDKDKPKKVEK